MTDRLRIPNSLVKWLSYNRCLLLPNIQKSQVLTRDSQPFKPAGGLSVVPTCCRPTGVAAAVRIGRESGSSMATMLLIYGNGECEKWRAGEADRQAVAPKEGREWDAIREKSRYRELACSYCCLAGWMDGVKYRENDLNPARYRQHQLSNRMKRCFSFREPRVQNRKWKIEQLNQSSVHQCFHIVVVYNYLHLLTESVALYLHFWVRLLPHRNDFKHWLDTSVIRICKRCMSNFWHWIMADLLIIYTYAPSWSVLNIFQLIKSKIMTKIVGLMGDGCSWRVKIIT